MSKKHPKKTAPINYKKQLQKAQRQIQAQIKKQILFEKTQLAKQIIDKPCPQSTINLQFTPIDTWFFRESRPHDAAGASELSSLFPPPVRTLIGAVRSFLGEKLAINWQEFNSQKITLAKELAFKQAVGDADGLGLLSLRGAWLCQDNKRLYPAPYYLMSKKINNTEDYLRLEIGDYVECDLGKVRLAQLPKDKEAYKNVEHTWITAKGWQALLKGELPQISELIKAKDLLNNEARLGIARDNSSRSAIKGQLYQTQHLRLKDNVSIQLDITGLETRLVELLPTDKNHEIIRLGGEGRMAVLENKSIYHALPCLIAYKQSWQYKKIIIHFITAADFDGEMFPKTFIKYPEKTENDKDDKETHNNEPTYWSGKLLDIELIIESAVIAKVHREGGWAMQTHQPRAVKSYVPAGSAWFCKVMSNISDTELLKRLNGLCIGEESQWGRGQIIIGLWHDNK